MVRTYTARSRRTRSGFSLIELMVSIAVGGIALGSIYAIGSATTRNLRTQERVASSQGALRVAMEQIKDDLQRAGYMGTPNASLPGEACGSAPAPGTASAIINYVDDVAAARAFAGPTNENPASTFDQVTLMGNYATGGEYAGVTYNVTGSTITPNPNWQSFTRDFTDWTTGNILPGAITDAFPVGRMVRVHAQSETHHFGVITAVSTSPVAVTINPPIPNDCAAVGGWISPMNAIRYSVQAAAGDEAPQGTAAGPVAVLRRTEMNGANLTQPLLVAGAPIDDRAILDYVVGFNVAFRLGTGATFDWQPAAAASVNANPEQVRAAIIDLVVRTPEQDPHMLYVAGDPDLRSFKVFSGVPGAARVRRLRAEILLPNLLQ